MDSDSGSITPVATLDGIYDSPIDALAFNADTLYGVRRLGGGGQPTELITIDTSSGAITLMGASVNNLSAIAFGN